MADDERPVSIPTAQDKLLGDFENIRRYWIAIAEHAVQIAKTRRALYEAYLKEGFTEAQALELVKGSLVL